MVKFPSTLILLFCLSVGVKVTAQQADDIIGTWLTEEKTAKIEVFEENGKYHGKIIWLEEPMRDGEPKKDIHNPEASLQERPILGLRILENFEFDEDEWEDGTIYDPKSGNTYSCVIEKNGPNLEVTGYIGFSFIGRTTTWTPASGAE